MDCHSRPAHKVHSPNDAVDLALFTGRLDSSIPWVKSKVVTALVQPYQTKTEGLQKIALALRKDYPDPAQAEPIMKEAQAIYRDNFFPEQKLDWRTHPDFSATKTGTAAFVVTTVSTTRPTEESIQASSCNSCHLILAQGNGEKLDQVNPKGYNFVHIDSEYSEFACADCHTGGLRK